MANRDVISDHPKERKNRSIPPLLLLLLLGIFLGWICLFNPLKLEPLAVKTLVLAMVMIACWVLEWLPMPVVALFPLVVLPVWMQHPIAEVARHYADPVIFLFLGGFLLALSIEKWGLHRRIALNILLRFGTSGPQVIAGFMLATFLISMWLSNTATTMMMFPIALSVLSVLQNSCREDEMKTMSVALLLTIAYASNIGGLSTLVGTPPNIAYAGFINDHQPGTLNFMSWFGRAFPVAIAIALFTYLAFVKWLFRNTPGLNSELSSFIQKQHDQLGPWSVAELRVCLIFGGTALLWVIRTPLENWTSLPLTDAGIALFGALTLFVIPSESGGINSNTNVSRDKVERLPRLLEWTDTQSMAWGILILFGGGLALAHALEDSGLLQLAGNALAAGAPQSKFMLILLVTAGSIFLSEVMSNVAQVIVMAPILTAVAASLGLPATDLGIPMTLAASCAGMLPMGTPPNAIVFSSGRIPLREMLRAGLVVNLISIATISAFAAWWHR
ncbi:MAG: Sodium-dependent dicarboxylate transporter SdcS [Saprospiraceae bacterium]|jgi:sodium-dependent dicarboxylate transporter 2/3/5|nr:Sodium-dependent dicarboxylate transporter SdcS [Saprospiraceae bacterium]